MKKILLALFLCFSSLAAETTNDVQKCAELLYREYSVSPKDVTKYITIHATTKSGDPLFFTISIGMLYDLKDSGKDNVTELIRLNIEYLTSLIDGKENFDLDSVRVMTLEEVEKEIEKLKPIKETI